MILAQILIAVLLVSLISLIGIVTLGLKFDIRKVTFYSISLVSGTMLGGAFLHLIPEALASGIKDPLQAIAFGVLLFFVLEKMLIWRHCHLHQSPGDHSKPVAAKMIITGDAVHNFIDGVIIASAFMAGSTIGVSITIAIILHEIPQELGDFGILINGGYSVKQALQLNFFTASSSLGGALLTYFFLGTQSIISLYVLPVAAGGFLYIALADLIPQLHERLSFRQTVEQIALMVGGFGLMMLLKH